MVLKPEASHFLSAMEFFQLHEKKRSYGGKRLPSVPLQHMDYMELAEDYADYVCGYEKYVDSDPSRMTRERISSMTPAEYEADLRRVYGVRQVNVPQNSDLIRP